MIHAQPQQPDRPGLERDTAAEPGMPRHIARPTGMRESPWLGARQIERRILPIVKLSFNHNEMARAIPRTRWLNSPAASSGR